MRKIFIIVFVFCMQLIFAASKDSYYFQRAEEAYKKQNYGSCMQYCQKGVHENPKDGKCWAVIAEIYSKRAYARYAEALEAADKALATLPKKETYWIAFTHCIRGNVYYKIEDLPASKQSYMAAVALQPDNTDYLYCLADVCMDLKEYSEAITYYKRHIEVSPKTIYVYGNLAMAYYLNGDTIEAQRYCDLTNALSSGGNETAHRVLSRMALNKGDQVLACKEAANAMFCVGSWFKEADTLKQLCPDILLAAIRYEVSKADKDVKANATASYCCFQMNKYMEALYYLHKKKDLSDDPQETYGELAIVYDLVNAFDEAERYYQLAMQTDSSAGMWERLADNTRHRGEFQEAESLYRRALKDAPTNGLLYYWIAKCKTETGNYSAALQLLDTAQVLSEENDKLTLLRQRAEIYYLQGDKENLQQVIAEAQRNRQFFDKNKAATYHLYALEGNENILTEKADSLLNDKYANTEEYLDVASAYALLKNKERVLTFLKRYYESGKYDLFVPRYKRFSFLKGDQNFESLLAHYDSIRLAELRTLQARIGNRDTLQGVTELPFTRQGGVCRVKCAINGLPLFFVFDTGAADVSISSVEANFMLKNGYLTNADFMGKQNYVTATGEIHEGTIINLREVKVGDVVLRDIKASVVNNQSAPLLLGQSCFQRFGTVEVDNKAQVIRLLSK